VPVAVAIVPLLVALGRPRAAGAWALVLLAAFTAELLRIRRAAGGRVPCGCFGSRATVRTSAALLRNAALGTVALVVVTLGAPGEAIVWPAAPEAADLLPFVLAAGSVAATGLLAWRAFAWLTSERGPAGDAPAPAGWGRA
jgi:hypothetical protein